MCEILEHADAAGADQLSQYCLYYCMERFAVVKATAEFAQLPRPFVVKLAELAIQHLDMSAPFLAGTINRAVAASPAPRMPEIRIVDAEADDATAGVET